MDCKKCPVEEACNKMKKVGGKMLGQLKVEEYRKDEFKGYCPLRSILWERISEKFNNISGSEYTTQLNSIK